MQDGILHKYAKRFLLTLHNCACMQMVVYSAWGDNMGGKTSAKSKNAWIEKAYDRINLTVSKGQKDIIKAHAEAMGESLNGFINRAISETMERDKK